MTDSIGPNANPVSGISASPITGVWYWHPSRMRPRDILSKNLRALMAERPDLDTLPKITKASGISNGTLDRVRRAASALRVDDLAPLAAAFGIEPWELLLPPDSRGVVHSVMAAAQELAKYRVGDK